VAARRKSYGNIKVKKIYPIVNTTKQVSELKTVAFQLDRDQAIDLAKKLLGAAQNSRTIDVTGFRLRNIVTVTTPPE
jgi:hypothetical protein